MAARAEGTASGENLSLYEKGSKGCFCDDYFFGATALATGGGSVYGFVTKAYWVGGVLFAAGAVMVVALTRIRCLRPQAVLNDQIQNLEREKGELLGTLVIVRKELAELRTTKEQVVKEARRLQEEGQAQVEDLNIVRKELDAMVAKFESIQALYNAYKQKTEAFLAQLRLVKEGQEAVIAELEDPELGNQLGELSVDGEELQRTLESFRQEVGSLQTMQETILRLRQEVEALKAAAEQFDEGAEDVEATAADLMQLLGDLSALREPPTE